MTGTRADPCARPGRLESTTTQGPNRGHRVTCLIIIPWYAYTTMAKDEKNITLEGLAQSLDHLSQTVDDLARIVADGFAKVSQRLDKIEQILATMSNTLVGVQEELRDLRQVVLVNHERRLNKLEESILK